MNSKRIILLLFILVALLQIYVPAKMIFNREDVLQAGKEFKFRAAPVDPSDPFRGKYITLHFAENTFDVPNGEVWVNGETIYVLFTTDLNGFAKIRSVSKSAPASDQFFLKANVDYFSANKITIDYPFDRFYMDELKAGDAERIYRQSLQDTARVTYGLVSILDGEAVLKDVLLNGISIKEMVKTDQQTSK